MLKKFKRNSLQLRNFPLNNKVQNIGCFHVTEIHTMKECLFETRASLHLRNGLEVILLHSKLKLHLYHLKLYQIICNCKFVKFVR